MKAALELVGDEAPWGRLGLLWPRKEGKAAEDEKGCRRRRGRNGQGNREVIEQR